LDDERIGADLVDWFHSMPLHSNVLVSAYSLGLDGSEPEPASGVLPVVEDLPENEVVLDAPVAADSASVASVEVSTPAHATQLVPPTLAEPALSSPAVPEGADDDDEERPSRPIARIAIARVSAMSMPASPAECRGVELALTGVPESHVTVALLDGTVLHEGPTGDDGKLAVRVAVPRGHGEIRAMLETGSKHRTALVPIAEDGRTEFTFR